MDLEDGIVLLYDDVALLFELLGHILRFDVLLDLYSRSLGQC